MPIAGYGKPESKTRGRPIGSFGRQKKHAEEVLARHEFDSLSETVILGQQMKGVFNRHLASMIAQNIGPGQILPNYDADLCAVGHLYLKILEAINSYAFPKLKSLEVKVEQDITEHRAPTEKQVEMIKQIADKLGWDFRPKEPAQLAGPQDLKTEDGNSIGGVDAEAFPSRQDHP